jgi:hypothetical protein
MHLRGKKYDMEHIIHLIREVDYLKTQLQPHDTGHIHTTISTLENRISQLMKTHDAVVISNSSVQNEAFPYLHDSDYHGC